MNANRSTQEDYTHLEPATNSDLEDDLRIKPKRETPPVTPRWVKLFAMIVIILILLFGILHLTGNSLGGPNSHMPSMDHSGQQP